MPLHVWQLIGGIYILLLLALLWNLRDLRLLKEELARQPPLRTNPQRSRGWASSLPPNAFS